MQLKLVVRQASVQAPKPSATAGLKVRSGVQAGGTGRGIGLNHSEALLRRQSRR
jgi:hypothetical protein